jgi:hypothetical protein
VKRRRFGVWSGNGLEGTLAVAPTALSEVRVVRDLDAMVVHRCTRSLDEAARLWPREKRCRQRRLSSKACWKRYLTHW